MAVKKGLIDIHCHLLPEIDDGAKSIEETVQMLAMAHKNGTRGIIVTPHYHEGRYKTNRAEIEKKFQRVKKIAGQACKTFHVYLGQEIYYQQDTLERLDAEELLTMADSAYVLIEFSTRITFQEMKNAFQSLILGGYVPILAHVERYECMYENVEQAEELVELGAYIQVNGQSLVNGSFKMKQYIKMLLKRELVHLIASDAHGSEGRVPELRNAYQYIERKYGKEYAEELMIDNPERIINNEYI